MSVYDVLVVGSGHAGATAAMELVARGYAGTIGVLGAELESPYQRPPLTKGYLAGDVARDSLALGRPGFWSGGTVTLLPGTEVVEVDPQRRTVTTATGDQVGYGSLVWAAGGRSRPLGLPHEDSSRVHRIRTVGDADAMRGAIGPGRHLVVVGGGFVGLETASAAAKAGTRVTVLEAQDRLLARVTSADVSGYFLQRHRAAGVDVRLGEQVLGLRPGPHSLGVETSSGETLEADAVLVAIGIVPETDVLVRAGARCGDGVEVDDHGRTSLPDVYAVGDCASLPYALHPRGRTRLECIQNATDAAKTVVSVLVGEPAPYLPRPWFWSHQYDVSFKSVGLVGGHDDAIVRGDPGSGRFSVVYLARGAVLAVDTVNATKDYVDARSMLGRTVDVARVTDASVRLASA